MRESSRSQSAKRSKVPEESAELLALCKELEDLGMFRDSNGLGGGIKTRLEKVSVLRLERDEEDNLITLLRGREK